MQAYVCKGNDLNIFNDVSKSRKGHAVHTVYINFNLKFNHRPKTVSDLQCKLIHVMPSRWTSAVTPLAAKSGLGPVFISILFPSQFVFLILAGASAPIRSLLP
jgi:hypothetical protein